MSLCVVISATVQEPALSGHITSVNFPYFLLHSLFHLVQYSLLLKLSLSWLEGAFEGLERVGFGPQLNRGSNSRIYDQLVCMQASLYRSALKWQLKKRC